MTNSDTPPPVLSSLLLAAAGLALATTGWAAFLWQQLLVSRRGGDPYCALGGTGCASLWDGAFANQVHAWTGLPVAGWGVAWGLVALVVALVAWRQVRAGRSPEPAWSAAAWVAAAGAVGVLVLLGAGLRAGEFCSNCAIIQILVATYAGVVFVGRSALAPSEGRRGALLAFGATVGGFLLLLYPGQATPRAGGHLGTAALSASATADDPDASLRAMLEGLDPAQRQTLANARAAYAQAKPVRPRLPRTLVGDPFAPVRLTTFTDSGCGHCAVFHEALEQLLAVLPPGRMAVEQRVFPLDGSCNTAVRARGRAQVCLAAQVRVCLEDDPRALDLAGWLHTDAAPLGTESIYTVAERLASRAEIEACVASGETSRKIAEDIDLALEAGLQGTPFLLVNGRPAPAFVPFLYALALTGGELDHPVFDGLPAPVAAQPGHEGHAH